MFKRHLSTLLFTALLLLFSSVVSTPVLAQYSQNPFGQIQAPGALSNFGDITTGGFGNFLTLIFRLMIVGGGIFALFNIILAGYAFLSAGDDPKKMEGAWAKIFQSLIGLSFIAGAFVLAAIFGKLLFGDFNTIINPQIPTIEDITP
ncbi:hypothetical protein A2125_01235 [Candidatus Woesebacteria bacterium GWB1_43_5]|uniref:Uncharacterized protein n=1 Tax=Candidatus Woesebacteria bacterium GWB1_43_5 TaxID=1802474 RepID=A0A1F7WRN1_9BACT|nr:MAG: hypothetical protein A2125_01235 [Candidatus Woesebacteria bacterium GWB1_43_5]